MYPYARGYIAYGATWPGTRVPSRPSRPRIWLSSLSLTGFAGLESSDLVSGIAECPRLAHPTHTLTAPPLRARVRERQSPGVRCAVVSSSSASSWLGMRTVSDGLLTLRVKRIRIPPRSRDSFSCSPSHPDTDEHPPNKHETNKTTTSSSPSTTTATLLVSSACMTKRASTSSPSLLPSPPPGTVSASLHRNRACLLP